MQTWAALVHSAIVPLRDVHVQKCKDGMTRAYLVMDRAPMDGLGESPDVVTFVNAAGGALQELQVAFILYQVLGALAYMHALMPPVMHRDLKPENVLTWACEFTRDGLPMPVVKLADFGGARVMEDGAGGTSVGHGTLQYMAPENIRLQMLGDRETKYALPADIYSIGAMMFVLLTGNLIFPPSTHPKAMVEAMEAGTLNYAQPNISARSAPCQDLLKKMLAPKPEDRLTAAQALAHPFFNEIRLVARPPACSW